MRYRLLQARVTGDPVIHEEHLAFAEQLRVTPKQLERFDLLSSPLEVEAIIHDVDAVIVGGSGAFSVLDDVPWIHRFIDLLGEVTDVGFPMFASCFGFQGLVVALGGRVEHDEAQSEVGSYDLVRTQAASTDPLFSTLPDRFIAQLGHKDRATVMPSSLINLAASERCPFQAFRVPGKPIYGTQFHPELSWTENKKRFGRYYEMYSKAFGTVEAERMMREGFRPSQPSNDLLFHFGALLSEGKLGATSL